MSLKVMRLLMAKKARNCLLSQQGTEYEFASAKLLGNVFMV